MAHVTRPLDKGRLFIHAERCSAACWRNNGPSQPRHSATLFRKMEKWNLMKALRCITISFSCSNNVVSRKEKVVVFNSNFKEESRLQQSCVTDQSLHTASILPPVPGTISWTNYNRTVKISPSTMHYGTTEIRKIPHSKTLFHREGGWSFFP